MTCNCEIESEKYCGNTVKFVKQDLFSMKPCWKSRMRFCKNYLVYYVILFQSGEITQKRVVLCVRRFTCLKTGRFFASFFTSG